MFNTHGMLKKTGGKKPISPLENRDVMQQKDPNNFKLGANDSFCLTNSVTTKI